MFNRSIITAIAFALFVLVMSCTPAESLNGFYLSGTLSPKRQGKLMLYRIDTTSSHRIDSAIPDATGAFSIFVETDSADFYFLENGQYFSSPFSAFPGDSIQISYGDAGTALIHGGREAGRYSEFGGWLAQSEKRLDSLSENLESSRYRMDYASILLKSDSIFGLIRADLKKKAVRFIQSNPDLLSNILVINSSIGRTGLFEESIDYLLFFEIDSLLQTYQGSNKHVVYFHNRVNRLKAKITALQDMPANLSPGARAPEILLPGTSGKLTSLHDHSAKFTLIYFWNPQEISGRQSNMELKLLYEKYKANGFSVFGVAFDSDVSRFKDAVNMDKLWWINVNDTLGLQSPVLKTYQVEDFPSLVLMDKKGNILDRFLSVKALAQWMTDHF